MATSIKNTEITDILKELGNNLQDQARSMDNTSTEFAQLIYEAETLLVASEIYKKHSK